MNASKFLCTGAAFGTVTKSLAKTFTVPGIVFNKRLTCLNDHCLKMKLTELKHIIFL